MTNRLLIMLAVAIVSVTWPTLASAAVTTPLPACAELATNPAYGLAGNPAVSNLSATVVPVAPGLTRQPGMGQRSDASIAITVAYCLVEFWFDSGKSGPADGYQPGQRQAIGIRVGLPLRADDGGTGAWNGKIHNLGSGGCMGRFPLLTPATNDGYAGAVSDGGHTSTSDTPLGLDCNFGVNQATRTLNVGLLRDFTGEHVIWQTRWSKQLTRIYYGSETKRTYWTGCSQGGREAHLIAQTIPHEYDGVLGGGAALWWMQMSLQQAWAGLVIKDRAKGLWRRRVLCAPVSHPHADREGHADWYRPADDG